MEIGNFYREGAMFVSIQARAVVLIYELWPDSLLPLRALPGDVLFSCGALFIGSDFIQKLRRPRGIIAEPRGRAAPVRAEGRGNAWQVLIEAPAARVSFATSAAKSRWTAQAETGARRGALRRPGSREMSAV